MTDLKKRESHREKLVIRIVKKKLTSLKKVFPYKYMGKNNFVELDEDQGRHNSEL